MTSSDFILPAEGPFTKEEVIADLISSFNAFRHHATLANIDDLVEGLPLGDVTKLELLHFILYHTQRYLHQLNKISEALKKNQEGLCSQLFFQKN